MHSPTPPIDFSSRSILSRRTLGAPFQSFPSPRALCLPVGQTGLCGKSPLLKGLRSLVPSLRSFSRSHHLVSTACSLFCKDTRSGVSLARYVGSQIYRFASLLFSYSYELLFSQALCFDNDLRCRGVSPSNHFPACGNFLSAEAHVVHLIPREQRLVVVRAQP
jgi:hypothetical protein